MNRLIILSLFVCGLSACEKPITSTFVEGTVSGVSIPNASAVSVTDTNLLGGARHTVWLASGLKCTDIGSPGFLDFGASPVLLPDGGRQQALIVSDDGRSYLDTGLGAERFNGTTDRYFRESAESDTTVKARFVASFGTTLDGGAFDGGSFSGDFVAPPCARADAGCSTAPGLLLPLLLLLALRKPLAT